MLEQEIKELTAAVKELTEVTKVMNAGREEALKALQEQAKNEGAPAASRRSRASKKDEAQADTAPAAETAAPASDAPSWNPDLSKDGTRKLVGDYLNVEDAEAKKARTANVKAVLAHFGADAMNPIADRPEIKSVEGDDERRQAVFYITRFANGLTVDFSADYDFNSDPLTQGDMEPAAEPAADDDILA